MNLEAKLEVAPARGVFEIRIDGKAAISRKGGLLAMLFRKPWPTSSLLNNSGFSIGLHISRSKAAGSPRSCSYAGGSDNAARRFVEAERGVAVFQRAARVDAGSEHFRIRFNPSLLKGTPQSASITVQFGFEGHVRFRTL